VSEKEQLKIKISDKVLDIFNKLKDNPEIKYSYDDFRKRFDELFSNEFSNFKKDTPIHLLSPTQHINQDLTVHYFIEQIPIVIANDLHGISLGIMQGILHELALPFGIVIRIDENIEPDFQRIVNFEE